MVKKQRFIVCRNLQFSSGGARPQNLGGGGHLRGKLIFSGGKIEFLKRYCYLPMPLSQDFCPPPRRFAPLSKGGDIYLVKFLSGVDGFICF